jgi:hypothetical protein
MKIVDMVKRDNDIPSWVKLTNYPNTELEKLLY